MVLVSINGSYALNLLAEILSSPSIESTAIFVKYTGNVKCNGIRHEQINSILLNCDHEIYLKNREWYFHDFL